MRQQIRFLTHALGRRETIKYLSIAAVGAAIAPLTGCSGSTLAFKKFAAGTWEINIPQDSHERKITLTIEEGGTWKADVTGKVNKKEPARTEKANGTWKLAGTNLSITEESDRVLVLVSDGKGTVSSIPETVDQEKMLSSIQWAFENGGLDVPVVWDKDSQTLTLTGQDPYDNPLPIIAVKKK